MMLLIGRQSTMVFTWLKNADFTLRFWTHCDSFGHRDYICYKEQSQMRVFIDGTGCILRKLDENRLRNYFVLNNSEIVNNPGSTDYTLYVTCGVLTNMVTLCMNKIKEYSSTGTPLIVAGCLPVIAPNLIQDECTPYTMVPTNSLEKIDEVFPMFKVK